MCGNIEFCRLYLHFRLAVVLTAQPGSLALLYSFISIIFLIVACSVCNPNSTLLTFPLYVFSLKGRALKWFVCNYTVLEFYLRVFYYLGILGVSRNPYFSYKRFPPTFVMFGHLLALNVTVTGILRKDIGTLGKYLYRI